MARIRLAGLSEAEPFAGRHMRSRLTTYILIGMILGILVGYLCSIIWPDPQTDKVISGYIGLITDLFLRLIKMIIAPLVFSTLVVGIAHRACRSRSPSRRSRPQIACRRWRPARSISNAAPPRAMSNAGRRSRSHRSFSSPVPNPAFEDVGRHALR